MSKNQEPVFSWFILECESIVLDMTVISNPTSQVESAEENSRNSKQTLCGFSWLANDTY